MHPGGYATEGHIVPGDLSDSNLSESSVHSARNGIYPRFGKRGGPQAFPSKLFQILSTEDPAIVGWHETGKGFVVRDNDRFCGEVLKKYFRGESYPSFQRQLNLYGFRKVMKGDYAGCYVHNNFVRDREDLLVDVRRARKSIDGFGLFGAGRGKLLSAASEAMSMAKYGVANGNESSDNEGDEEPVIARRPSGEPMDHREAEAVDVLKNMLQLPVSSPTPAVPHPERADTSSPVLSDSSARGGDGQRSDGSAGSRSDGSSSKGPAPLGGAVGGPLRSRMLKTMAFAGNPAMPNFGVGSGLQSITEGVPFFGPQQSKGAGVPRPSRGAAGAMPVVVSRPPSMVQLSEGLSPARSSRPMDVSSEASRHFVSLRPPVAEAKTARDHSGASAVKTVASPVSSAPSSPASGTTVGDDMRVQDENVPDAETENGSYSEGQYPRFGKRGAPQAFAQKLFQILSKEDPAIIAWSPSGTAFKLNDPPRFSAEVLAKYFRRNTLSSFQRQLNLYGFKKITRAGPDQGCVSHPHFRKGQPDLLYYVRRCVGRPSSGASSTEGEYDSVDMEEEGLTSTQGRSSSTASLNLLQARSAPPLAPPPSQQARGPSSAMLPSMAQQMIIAEGLSRPSPMWPAPQLAGPGMAHPGSVLPHLLPQPPPYYPTGPPTAYEVMYRGTWAAQASPHGHYPPSVAYPPGYGPPHMVQAGPPPLHLAQAPPAHWGPAPPNSAASRMIIMDGHTYYLHPVPHEHQGGPPGGAQYMPHQYYPGAPEQHQAPMQAPEGYGPPAHPHSHAQAPQYQQALTADLRYQLGQPQEAQPRHLHPMGGQPYHPMLYGGGGHGPAPPTVVLVKPQSQAMASSPSPRASGEDATPAAMEI